MASTVRGSQHLLARGYTNKQVAQALGLREATIKWHLKSLFDKLGVNSRQHAVARARTMGHLAAST